MRDLWTLSFSGDGTRPPERESQFALGTGAIGQRTILSEIADLVAVPGTFRNGFADLLPMHHAEWAYGFPEVVEQMVQIPEVGTFQLLLDGVAPLAEQLADLTETLDLQNGIYTRTYHLNTPQGTAEVKLEKLASFVLPNVLASRVEVVYDGKIEIGFGIHGEAQAKAALDSPDPRVAEVNHELTLAGQRQNEGWTEFDFETQPSGHPISTALRVAGSPHLSSSPTFAVQSIAGSGQLTAEAFALVVATDTDPALSDLQKSLATRDFAALAHEQAMYLKAFWATADIEIQGDAKTQLGLRYALFQMLQSTGRTGRDNIAAKGLTGEGYGGHTFWDTEMYILPALQLAHPELAKPLLDYRHRMLPAAKARAAELGHLKGAAYPWRTITGLECSGYFPAGTAQYHLNADIAHAFVQYYLQTGDLDFFLEKGLDVLVETGRIWLEIGNRDGDRFHIHDVTGPDEYTAIVSDNYFTNKMAQANLHWARKAVVLAKDSNNPKVKKALEALDITADELEAFHWAEEHMMLIKDPDLGIHAQDSSFLEKPLWPKEQDKRPLLLNYHPLTIYRHRVLKQADTVLANAVFAYDTDAEIATRDYNYYSRLTTHDSSLSACVHSRAAARIGQLEDAKALFDEAVRLDLENTHANTKDGLHMANFGGLVLALSHGFAGLAFTKEGLALAPVLPPGWDGYAFAFNYRGQTVRLAVDGTTARITAEAPLELLYYGLPQRVDGELILPLRDPDKKAVLFDLDGVLTSTSLLHFAAWQDLAKELDFTLPEDFETNLRGVSRMESLERVLRYGDKADQYTEEEKIELATRKNEAYKASIQKVTPEDLFPGTLELLQALKERGIKTALVSASRNAPALIERLGIKDLFDTTVHPDEIDRGKPHPDPFLKGAEKLGVLPAHCLGVEDAPAGIESIRTAGMWQVAIGERVDFPDVTEVFATIKEASPYILRWEEEQYG